MRDSCDCGLSYVSGVPEDEKLHDKIHYEYSNGVNLPDLNALSSIDMVANYPLFVVDGKVPSEARRRLTKAVEPATIEMISFPAGYDGTITEVEQRLFILADDNQAIGFIITAWEEYHWKLKWTRDSILECTDSTAEHKLRHTICRIWIAKSYRERGIGPMMIKAVANYLECKVTDLSWELPLTEDGVKLVHKLLPQEWLGRGDGYTLQKTLEKNRDISQ